MIEAKKLSYKIRADNILGKCDTLIHEIDDDLETAILKLNKEVERQQRVAEKKLKPRYIYIDIKLQVTT